MIDIFLQYTKILILKITIFLYLWKKKARKKFAGLQEK